MTTAVPLSALRGMPQRGAPGVALADAEHEDGYTIRAGESCTLLGVDSDQVVAMAATPGAWHVRAYDRDALALDLSTPADDRIDGATVAATMLAQAAGLDVSRGVTWDVRHRHGRTTVYVYAGQDFDAGFSHMLDADPAGVDALAAVLLAVLGVTP